MFKPLLFFIIFCNTAFSAPIFVEDGSLPVSKWYHGNNNISKNIPLIMALQKEGITPQHLYDYDFIQDIALFDQSSNFLIQAPIPSDPDILTNLTLGVLNNPDGIWELLRLTPNNLLGLKNRPMASTFIEGGALITGSFSNGEVYAIAEDSVLDRIKKYYGIILKQELTKAQAVEKMAEDFEIRPENIFLIPNDGHIDLVMMALPGGRILLNDPSKTLDMLKTLDRTYDLTPYQKERLNQTINLYEFGFQRKDIFGNSFGALYTPYDQRQINQLNKIADILKDRFEVIRLPGVINTLEKYANSDSLYMADRINFFNGFLGKGSTKKTFVMTNKTPEGMEFLEKHWHQQLTSLGIDANHIYFVGNYSTGAGLDCAGAIAP